MLEFVILAGLAYTGYAAESGWWVLAGAAAMTIAGWWRKVKLLRQHPQVPFSSKMTTYLVVSVAVNLAYAIASLAVGRLLRVILSG